MTLEKAVQILAERYEYIKRLPNTDGMFLTAEKKAIRKLIMYVGACQHYLFLDIPEDEIDRRADPNTKYPIPQALFNRYKVELQQKALPRWPNTALTKPFKEHNDGSGI